MATSRLKSNLPLTVDWLTHTQIAIHLGIHVSQYRRDLTLLSNLGIIQRNKGGKGYFRETIAVLELFRNLVKEKGRFDAARELLEIWRKDNGN